MPSSSDSANQLNCLIADDDITLVRLIRERLATAFPEVAFQAEADVARCVQLIQDNKYHLAVLDLNFGPGFETFGLELAKKIISKDPTSRVIVLTGQRDKLIGWTCLREGVQNFINKPFDFEHLHVLFQEAINQWHIRQSAAITATLLNDVYFFGSSEAGQKLKEQTIFCASNNLPVLILGETGTGKSSLARLIHDLSQRREKNFCVFCPGLVSEEHVYTELFGAKKGSYTGLSVDRVGLVATSAGGTLFIDEIGDLPISSQIMLLKVVQDKKFRPLGSSLEETSDFRLISATNADLSAKIRDGKFREDLYYRISSIILKTPSLRELTADLPNLIAHLLAQIAREHDSGNVTISEEAIRAVRAENYPGNIRQLRHVLERAYLKALFDGSSCILLSHIHDSSSPQPEQSLNSQVDEFRKSLIEQALLKTNFNQSHAAEILKIDRNQLRRYMQRYGIVSKNSRCSFEKF